MNEHINTMVESAKNDRAIEQVLNIASEALPGSNEDPILGITDDLILAANFREFLNQPTSILETLNENGKILAFSVAIPINVMDPARQSESTDTAYLYLDAVKKEEQGKGIIAKVHETLFSRLKDAGYSFVELDAKIDNGYADKVEKAYKGKIVSKYDHENFPEFGRQRFFRIVL